MPRLSRWARHAAPLLAAVALVAGCGGKAEVSTATTAGPPSTTVIEAGSGPADQPSASAPGDTGSGDGQDVAAYCADLDALASLLGSGGSDAEYNALLAKVIAQSPASHAETWRLMLSVSEEPFSYENFNPAVDSLERIGPDLEATCDGVETMIVNDDGRLTRLEDR